MAELDMNELNTHDSETENDYANKRNEEVQSCSSGIDKDTEIDHKTRKAVSWIVALLVTALVSAYIGSVIEDYRSRAQPSFVISAIEFARLEPSWMAISIPPQIIRDASDLPFKLAGLKRQMTFSELKVPLRTLFEFTTQMHDAHNVLDKLLEQIETSPMGLSQNNTRRKLLELWHSAPGNILNQSVTEALRQNDYLSRRENDSVYEKYSEHPLPPEGGFLIDMGATRGIDLSELLDTTTPDLLKKESTALGNFLRRVWLYQDKQVMSELFSDTRMVLSHLIQQTKSFFGGLKGVLDNTSPRRVKISVVVNNLGEKAAVFSGETTLETKASSYGRGIFLNPINQDIEQPITFAVGKDPELIQLYSLNGAEPLLTEMPEGSIVRLAFTQIEGNDRRSKVFSQWFTFNVTTQ